MPDQTLTQIEYLSRIRGLYSSLNTSERRIADYIFEHDAEIAEMSAKTLGENTSTSAATVVRFCRSLGFKGFTEFKYYIERELLSPDAGLLEISPGESVSVIKQKVFSFNRAVLDESVMILDDQNLQKAIEAIENAKRLDIYGEGGSGSAALAAVNVFMQIGIASNAYSDAFLQVTAASQLHPGDVAIAISHSGRVINTIDAIKEAKHQGATTIGITGYAKAPMMDFVDIPLFTSSRVSNVLSDLPAARISELCVIGVIQMALVVRNHDRLAGQISKAKEIFKLKRV